MPPQPIPYVNPTPNFIVRPQKHPDIGPRLISSASTILPVSIMYPNSNSLFQSRPPDLIRWSSSVQLHLPHAYPSTKPDPISKSFIPAISIIFQLVCFLFKASLLLLPSVKYLHNIYWDQISTWLIVIILKCNYYHGTIGHKRIIHPYFWLCSSSIENLL